MNVPKNFKDLGLSDNESKVYLAALELGETTVARISKKSGVERTSCYGIIDDLKALGLIAMSRKGRKHFYYAESPKRLESILAERMTSLRGIMPELMSLANTIDKKPKVRFYDDAEGIMDIYRETLDYPDRTISIWMSERGVWYDNDKFWKKFYIPARLEKKIRLRVIAKDSASSRELQEGDRASLRETRFDSARDYPIESEIMLYGSRHIAVISVEEGIGLVLESEKLYRTLLGIFSVHWTVLGK